ncbi:MAG: hypothetical protein JXE06_06005 [Coriobacteriia bacterium]|nr:hypothetical protein [Coriobacteriia bacterium]MBN2823212.1 hypothetical protein [Coriobacteriia bacterium]
MRSVRLRTRLTAVALASVLLIAMLPGTAVAEKTLGLSTGSFDFSVAPGGTGQGELVVMNDGDETLDILVYSANQVVDATGTVTYEIPNRDTGNFDSNPASWISVKIPSSTQTLGNTPLITLEPGERAPVQFFFTVPTAAAPGDHQLLLFFEMLAPEGPEEGASANVMGRLGARIRIRVQGDLVERIDVLPFSVRSPILGDEMSWVYLIRNEGNIDKSVTAKLALLDGDENEVWSSEVASETVVYAETNLERSGVAEGVPAFGRFTARLTVEYPREGASAGTTILDQVVKDRTVWIAPLWLAIGVVVLIALVLMYISWRHAVKVAERKAHATIAAAGRSAAPEGAPESEEPAE